MKNIYDQNKKDLQEFFIKHEEKPFRADQIWNWLYVRGIKSFDEITNISKKNISLIKENFYISELKIKKKIISKDKTTKWVFLLEDNKEIETVYIPEGKRGTVCVSSQVGCSLACSFCHTGTMKLQRNLTLGEITGQVLKVKNELRDWCNGTEDRKVTNIVFMGMGEPLLNYKNVIDSLDILSDERGLALSKRKITLSTSGIVPSIEKFKYEKDVNLAISLHAVSDKIRDELVPINKKWPLSKLMSALSEYKKYRTKKRITFEYIMLENINDSLADADRLIELLRPLKAKVNLIPFNPWLGSKYRVTSKENIEKFKNRVLNKGKIITTIRASRGEDVLAACGQLKSL